MNWKAIQVLFVLIVWLSMAAMATPANADKKLSGAEIRKLMPGNYTIVVFGFDINIVASRGDQLKVSFLDETDTGKWTVKGTQLCISLTVWMHGKTGCSEITYDGKKWFTAGDLRFWAK